MRRHNLLIGFTLALLRYIARVMQTREGAGFEAARALVLTGEGVVTMRHVQRVIADMEGHEERLLAQRDAVSRQQTRHAQWLLVAGGLVDVGLLLFVFIFVRRDQRLTTELARAADEARQAAVRSAELRSQSSPT